MPFKRTDKGKINWPRDISSKDRRFCRKIYDKIPAIKDRNIILACSAGLDSSVLVHAFSQMCVIKGVNKDLVTVAYVDHGLRPVKEISSDIDHVHALSKDVGFDSVILGVDIKKGNIQEQARLARYEALSKLSIHKNISGLNANVFLAHHADDNAETKLFQFLSGRKPTGINDILTWNFDNNKVIFRRPFLGFTREDLEKYKHICGFGFIEDSSNLTNKYTRNIIRHELIPWIKDNVNKGIVKTLSSEIM